MTPDYLLKLQISQSTPLCYKSELPTYFEKEDNFAR